MKISPVASPAHSTNALAPGGAASIAPRILKMTTQATPGRLDFPVQAQVEELPPAVVSKADTSGEEKAGDEATQPLSPQYAALAKERRALQVKERAIADREKALADAAKTGVEVARLKSDPLGVLLEAGVTYEQLTQAVLERNDGISPKVQGLEAKLKELEEGLDKKLSDRDQQAKQQALATMRREALGLVKEGDDFALVRETDSLSQVMQLIEKTYDESGEVLSVQEALSLYEAELLADAEKLAQIKKVREKAQPPVAQPLETQQRPAGMRTLTNRDTAQAPMDRKQRALLAAIGQLKK